MVVGTMRLAGPIEIPSDDTYYAQAVCGNMGQALLRPPSVEGWQGGSEWINTGAYVERINFATRVLNDPSKVGVRDIIDRIKTGNVDGMMTPDELVDNCLKVMGPISLLQSTSARLKEYASKYDDFDKQYFFSYIY